jgi:predicted nucleotidyltransferase
LTNGHLEHLKRAREETKADTVFCVMSGSFTQRGEAAIADKYIRASIAVRLGCDMVAELPTVFALSPADNFAFGAMKIISRLPDVKYLSFGSECGDTQKLEKMARLLLNEPEQIKEKISLYLSQGDSFPKARAKAVNEFVRQYSNYRQLEGLLDQPNNILGIAYIMAAKRLKMKIKFHTIKRMGGGFNDASVDSDYPSASAIRSCLRQGKIEELKNFVPPFTYNLLEEYKSIGTSLGDMALYRMKEISPQKLEKLYDVSGGLHNRLKIAADASNTYEQFLENAKTKKYTMAKIKRISLYALLGITKELYELASSSEPYVFILALNKDRKDILSKLSDTSKNTLVRYSDIDKVEKSLRPLIKLDFKAQGILGIINRDQKLQRTMLLI